MTSIKKKIAAGLIAVLLILSVSAYSENAEPFSFRNGISFGMTEQEIKQIESANEQVTEESWSPYELGNWNVILSGNEVKVSTTEAYLMYFLYHDQMQAAFYDFQRGKTEIEFDTITGALSKVYGESSPADVAEIVRLMDCFKQGFYSETDLSGGRVWQKENVTIYQFYYSENRFVIFYANPYWDYSNTPNQDSIDTIDTTGL